MKTMKCLLLGLALLIAGSVSAQTDENAIVKVGETVPEFTVQMVDGSKIDIKELRGKVVLVNFWATWCPPCQAEFKRVPAEIVEQFKDEDFVFLPISREETLETLLAYREKTGYVFPMGMDPEREIFAKFALNSIPRNYLVDKNGKVVVADVGYSAEHFDELIGKIKAELKK